MSAELARDPGSLVFIPLGEALRTRGQGEAAQKVVRAGLERYPDSSEARDLLARLLVDAGDLDAAEQEWTLLLGSDSRHLGARKGLGFLAYRKGDLDNALDHLELALSVDPTDQNVIQAIRTVRATAAGLSAPEEPAALAGPEPRVPFSGPDRAERGVLLVDARGLVLGGGLRNPAGTDVGDAVAALLSGVTQEAERTSRMLELGEWTSIVAEAADGNMLLTRPSKELVLLLVRDRSVPPARLAILAEKAAAEARAWLKEQAP
jgi:predicted regulator of Ras-like GTPase activity (Roadblock/LC7/MglB family)